MEKKACFNQEHWLQMLSRRLNKSNSLKFNGYVQILKIFGVTR